MERFDVVVVGGGVIGLACARHARNADLRVRVLERGRSGDGATRAAAGILAPDAEPPGLARLGRRSAGLWPAFAQELLDETGHDVGYARCGSLVPAFAASDPREDGEWLDGDGLRALEPGVSSLCIGATLVAGDARVDPRRVVAALAESLGDALQEGAEVVAVEPGGVRLADGGGVAGECVLVAAGAWARGVLPELPVRPVKGQTIRFRGDPPVSRIVRREHVYVVPHASGETVVGATVEEGAGFDDAAGDEVTRLLHARAAELVPALREREPSEATASLRPAIPDEEPLIGEWNGLLVATGHHRNGVLLAPATAEEVAALLRA